MLSTENEARDFLQLPRDLMNDNALKNYVCSLLLHKFDEICKLFCKYYGTLFVEVSQSTCGTEKICF